MMLIIDKLARAPLSQVLLFAGVWTLLRVLIYPYLKNTAKHKRSGLYSFARIVNELSDALVYAAIVVFMLVRPFGIQTFWIPSGSMIDTLHLNDFIVANKFIYRFNEPQAGDIVVFNPPSYAPARGEGQVNYIKRLIGTPGQTIEIKNKVLYRDGKPVDETYVDYTDRFTQQVLPKADWKNVEIPDFKLVEDKGKLIPLTMTFDQVNNRWEVNGSQATAEPYIIYDRAEMDRLRALPAAKIPAGYFLFMGDNRNGSSDGRYWGLAPRKDIIGRSEFRWLPIGRMGITR